jgi:predicted nucleic acid-binding Zn ribbon protein
MPRPDYPTKGAWHLDEIEGVLHYRGSPIAAIAELSLEPPPWRPDHRSTTAIGLPARREMRALLQKEGIANPQLYAIYRCARCEDWTIGNGTTFCSAECRRAFRAQQARQRRAATARTMKPVICVVCGGPAPNARSSRRYCSNRCRQQDYRSRKGSPQAAQCLPG